MPAPGKPFTGQKIPAMLIKDVRGRTKIEFGQGSFDGWCVYLSRNGERRYAPRDSEYFARLKSLGMIHGAQKIYADFVQVYDRTSKDIEPAVLQLIESLCRSYGNDAEELELWLTIIYAGMVAEENKERAVLKKRIKRLGMHQVLIEGMDATAAAGFSRGKPWQELDALMRARQF